MGRRRKMRLEFYVSEKELHMIQQKMAQIGTNNCKFRPRSRTCTEI